MTMEMIRSALGWCILINFGVLLWWFAWFTLAHNWVYRVHGKWFKMSVEQFDAIHYGGMTVFKLCILVFNLAPYLALHIVG